jgi:tRNA A-37 threonylcarbamoyl transferase component Bud32
MNLDEVSNYVATTVAPRLGCAGAAIVSCSEIEDNSDVNWVYRVQLAHAGRERTLYVKRSDAFVKRRPDTAMDPQRATFEARMLGLVGDIVPDLVPRVLWHDPQAHLTVLAEIGRNAASLAHELSRGRIPASVVEAFGQTLGKLHAGTLGVPHETIWGTADANAQATKLSVAMRTSSVRALLPQHIDDLIAQSDRARAGLVLGDLASKNVLVGVDCAYVLDLELAFRGDQLFDVAFFLAHVVVEPPPFARASALAAAKSFWERYDAERKRLAPMTIDDEPRMLRWLGAMIMCRASEDYMGPPVASARDWRDLGASLVRGKDLNLDDVELLL